MSELDNPMPIVEYPNATITINVAKKGAQRKVPLNVDAFIRLNKFRIDMRALYNGKLSLRYLNHKNNATTFKSRTISHALKQLIHTLAIYKEFDKELFESLDKDDQDTFLQMTNACQVDVGLQRHDDFDENYKILWGEYQSGNEGAVKKLRRFIQDNVRKQRIGRKEALDLLDSIA